MPANIQQGGTPYRRPNPVRRPDAPSVGGVPFSLVSVMKPDFADGYLGSLGCVGAFTGLL